MQPVPDEIRRGDFSLPDGTKPQGWKMAAPGDAWNSTDAIVDPSLPSRRMILAACSATICVLHYERGVGLIDLVMSLVRGDGGWKATWLAYGHPPVEKLDALRALLRNRSSLAYHDDADAHIDY
ncbi:MAG TPA: hypothetical protein VGX91_13710 [Candidatus Cybelea sp.]|nr:hypothetical protein [Candidatus Cybelea sp.]